MRFRTWSQDAPHTESRLLLLFLLLLAHANVGEFLLGCREWRCRLSGRKRSIRCLDTLKMQLTRLVQDRPRVVAGNFFWKFESLKVLPSQLTESDGMSEGLKKERKSTIFLFLFDLKHDIRPVAIRFGTFKFNFDGKRCVQNVCGRFHGRQCRQPMPRLQINTWNVRPFSQARQMDLVPPVEYRCNSLQPSDDPNETAYRSPLQRRGSWIIFRVS